jgi:hypothetical protein
MEEGRAKGESWRSSFLCTQYSGSLQELQSVDKVSLAQKEYGSTDSSGWTCSLLGGFLIAAALLVDCIQMGLQKENPWHSSNKSFKHSNCPDDAAILVDYPNP